MAVPPLEILPYGATTETEAKRLASVEASKRRGSIGCFFWLCLFAGVAIFCWGWSLGLNSSLALPVHKEGSTERSESNG